MQATSAPKVEWDYTDLAESYLQRPDYSREAVGGMLKIADVGADSELCDVGAGVAHLTLLLAETGGQVTAVEPNRAMRRFGTERTRSLANVTWFEGTGEETGQPDATFDIVTFGSSFNVCDRARALSEAKRILKPGGWFACMWNHRDLSDPIQSAIEAVIASHVPDYDYGTRRQDQRGVIDASGLFGPVIYVQSHVVHRQSVAACIEAWSSHATLQRQCGDRFQAVLDDISAHLNGLGTDAIDIPYNTAIWMARLRSER